MDINRKLAQAYIQMHEAKTERASWVPESIADEDVSHFMGAAAAASKAGKSHFDFGGKKYKVTMKKDAAKKISEAEEACEDCGEVHEGSCNEDVKESTEELDEENLDEVSVGLATKTYAARKSKAQQAAHMGNKTYAKSQMAKAKKTKAYIQKREETEVKESPEEPRAKGEKDFKDAQMAKGEPMIDGEKANAQTLDLIKKSADMIKTQAQPKGK